MAARARTKVDELSWTCPGCAMERSTLFCPACGETRLRHHDLTVRGLLEQAVHAVISVDSRLLRSLGSLAARPGFLTAAYLAGRRKPYILPLQLFLITNVMAFAMQSLTGVKVFSTPLATHLHDQLWSGVARDLVLQRLATSGRTLEQYAPVFDQAVALPAPSPARR